MGFVYWFVLAAFFILAGYVVWDVRQMWKNRSEL
jgi:hypothetical protein